MWELEPSLCSDNITSVGLRGGQSPWAPFWAGDVSITQTRPAAICICLVREQFVVAQLVKAFEKVESALGFCGERTQIWHACLLLESGPKDHSLSAVTFRQNWQRRLKNFAKKDLTVSICNTSMNEIHADPQVNHYLLPSVPTRWDWFCKVLGRFGAVGASFPSLPALSISLNERIWSSFVPTLVSHTRVVFLWCSKFPPVRAHMAVCLLSPGSCLVASLGCPLTTCSCWRCLQRKALGISHVQSLWARNVAKSTVLKGCDNGKRRRYWPGTTGCHQGLDQLMF